MAIIDYDQLVIEELKHDHLFAKAYLENAVEEYFEDGDKKVFLVALRHLAEAKGGIGQLAKRTSMNREHLYRALSPQGNPNLEKFGAIIKVLVIKCHLRQKGIIFEIEYNQVNEINRETETPP
ncbi:MAG: putative addiction module antidote protein [Candidatus Pacebacteria bacterium]|nr:putative addiction module antidote protein [Candidatus Paceibacterota bacterium]